MSHMLCALLITSLELNVKSRLHRSTDVSLENDSKTDLWAYCGFNSIAGTTDITILNILCHDYITMSIYLTLSHHHTALCQYRTPVTGPLVTQ